MLDFNKKRGGKDKMSDAVCEVIAQLPTKYGTFEAHGYVDQRSGEHHVALVKEISQTENQFYAVCIPNA